MLLYLGLCHASATKLSTFISMDKRVNTRNYVKRTNLTYPFHQPMQSLDAPSELLVLSPDRETRSTPCRCFGYSTRVHNQYTEKNTPGDRTYTNQPCFNFSSVWSFDNEGAIAVLATCKDMRRAYQNERGLRNWPLSWLFQSTVLFSLQTFPSERNWLWETFVQPWRTKDLGYMV